MQNGIIVKFNGGILTVLVVHTIEFLSINQILDIYAEKFGFERNKLSGEWTSIIDITSTNNGHAELVGFAKNDWPSQG